MTWPFMRTVARDCRIAFGQREELQVAQSAEHVELSDANSGFDFGFIFGGYGRAGNMPTP